MITYAVEPWGNFKHEAAELFPRHWREVAINRDTIKLNVDWARYERLDDVGALHVLVARSAGQIIGYWIGIIETHLHYADSLSAFTDVYYIAMDHRKGRAGIDLFKHAERSLKARGVNKIFTGTKKHLDMSRIFERLGYTATETLFTKVI